MIRIVTRVVLELIDSGKVNLAIKEDKTKSVIKTRHALSDKKVICMEDLRGIESGLIETAKNALITPLARDYIKEKGIEMVKL